MAVPMTTVEEVLARGFWRGIAPLEGIVTSPQFLLDGSILIQPGYDRRSGLYFADGERFAPIADRPAKTDAEQARDELLEIIGDFPIDDTGRAAWLAGRGQVIEGKASWYGGRFHGRRTASGERFNRHASTLASRGLPFRTRVRITNLHNGRTAVGRVNDRGPFVRGRVIDVSEALARRLGMRRRGTARVRVEVLR